MSNPFISTASLPGHGKILVAVLPPSTPVLQTVSYQYPLKLIAPSPIILHNANASSASSTVHTVFLLTYGGGLVAGDTINLSITLESSTRLILLTQGSTKIFKSPSKDVASGQCMSVDIGDDAALCYLPDPVQPFEKSAFGQVQLFNLVGKGQGSLCVCDWFCEGRRARGEKWDFWRYTSKNEVWLRPNGGRQRLLLRDNILLDESSSVGESFVGRVDGLGIFGSLIIHGPLFEALGKHFMDEFAQLPRIGNRKWDVNTKEEVLSDTEADRLRRQKRETADDLIWTAANIRGFVLVKFGAREVEGARRWLHHMLKSEGSVEQQFGERALLCLK